MYEPVLIELIYRAGGGSHHEVRARPVPGQRFPPDCFVECSSVMREAHPVGTLIIVAAKLKAPKSVGNAPHLYADWRKKYHVLPPKQRDAFLANPSAFAHLVLES